MSKVLQLRRGTTAETAVFTGHVGEVTVDTTTDSLVVHDNVTVGGHRQASETYVQNAIANIDVSNLNVNLGNLQISDTTISSINTNGNIYLVPNGSGNVNISSPLHIESNVGLRVGDANQLSVRINTPGSNPYNRVSFNTAVNGNANVGMLFSTNTDHFIFINPQTGNVGFNNTNPNYRLQVDGTVKATSLSLSHGYTGGVQFPDVPGHSDATGFFYLQNDLTGDHRFNFLHNGIDLFGISANIDQPSYFNTDVFVYNNFRVGGLAELPNTTVIGSGLNFSPVNAKLNYSDNVAGFSQFAMQNLSNSNVASTDVSIFSDNGNDSVNFVDMGITSSTYNDPTYSLYGPNDAYLLSAAAAGSKLILNTYNDADIVFATGGYTADKEVARFQNGVGFVANTHVIPATNNVYDLGTPVKQWRHIYTANGSIYLDNIKLTNNAGKLEITKVINPGQENEEPDPDDSEAGNAVTNKLVNGEHQLVLGSDGSLTISNNLGVIKNTSGNINLVATDFAQLQWTTESGAQEADPNETSEPLNWLYVDSTGIHLETEKNTGGYFNSLDLTNNFTVDLEKSHATFNANGQWNIGSNYFDTKIYSANVIDPNNYNHIIIQADGNDWTFDRFGNLQLPAGGDILDSNGQSVLGAGGNNSIYTSNTAPSYSQGAVWYNIEDGRTYVGYSNVWVDSSPVEVPQVSTYLGNLEVADGNNIITNEIDGSVRINDWDFTESTLTAPGDIVAGQGLTPNITGINLNNGNVTFDQYFRITNTNTDEYWSFAYNGTLSIPGDIIGPGDANLSLYSSYGSTITWANPAPYVAPNLHVNSVLTINANGMVYDTYRLDSSSNPYHFTWSFDNDGVFNLPNGGSIDAGNIGYPVSIEDPNGVTLLSGLGSGISVGSPGNVSAISVNSNIWIFDVDGSLSLPGAINSTSDAVFGHTTVGEFDVNGLANFAEDVEMMKDLLVHGNINFTGSVTQNIVEVQQGIFTGDDPQTGFGALYAGINQVPLTFLASTVFQMNTNSNEYTQMNYQNLSGGNQASAEYVITADNGTDTTGYLDIGMASSGWDGTQPNSLGSAVSPNDGYLYVQNGTGTSGGHLVLGVTSAAKKVKIVTDGPGSANVRAEFSSTGLLINGNVTASNFVGNLAGTATSVTNGVYTSGSYSNPAWITSLDAAKLTGTITATDGVVTTGSYSNPTWITGLAYSKLTGTPSFATVATSGSYTDLTNKPSLATVATSGSYTDLTNKPTGLVTTSDTSTVTNAMLAGSITNAKLANSSMTINGTVISLGDTATVTANANTLTGTTLASGVVNSSLTSVGTLTGLTVSGTITANAAAGGTSSTTAVGYLGLPQNSQSTNYGVVATDQGKHIYVSATSTMTIPANSNVAFPIGSTLTFIAGPGATVSIAITTDTMYLAGTGTTGTRTLAAYGMATAVKTAATTWFINGTGLT